MDVGKQAGYTKGETDFKIKQEVKLTQKTIKTTYQIKGVSKVWGNTQGRAINIDGK